MANATVGLLFPFGQFSANPLRTDSSVAGYPSGELISMAGVPWAGLYSGGYKIVGTCTLNGDPVSRRVYLTPHATAIFVAGVTTGADGIFVFDGLAAGKYTVYGVDLDGTTNGVIWDYIDAVPR